jgi:hypothetical protein
MSPRDDRAVAHDDAADWHLAGGGGGASLLEREIHEGGRGHDSITIGPALLRASTSLYTLAQV